MKRTFPIVMVAAALVLSACSGLSPKADAGGEPASFPTGTAVVPSGDATSVEAVVDKVLPAVVNVVTDLGEGTGFVVRQDGIVVTNYHVVEGASQIKVLSSDEDPKTYSARVIGSDVEADLAVLEIEAEGLATVPLGSSDDLRLGQNVVAIGYALGLQGGPSVTSGIVSSLTRHITVNDPNCVQCEQQGQRTYGQVIQTDAAINPGNSGGPLVDLAGNVVGINTAGNSTAENVGFAIQIDAAKPVIFGAADHPDAPVAFMGIGPAEASDPQFQFQFNPTTTQGVGIVDVVAGSPADDAGVQVGDVMVRFGGDDVSGVDEFRDAIGSHEPGDEVSVDLVRGDQHITVTLTLGTNPVPAG